MEHAIFSFKFYESADPGVMTCGISDGIISQIFKKQVGNTPKEYQEDFLKILSKNTLLPFL